MAIDCYSYAEMYNAYHESLAALRFDGTDDERSALGRAYHILTFHISRREYDMERFSPVQITANTITRIKYASGLQNPYIALGVPEKCDDMEYILYYTRQAFGDIGDNMEMHALLVGAYSFLRNQIQGDIANAAVQ